MTESAQVETIDSNCMTKCQVDCWLNAILDVSGTKNPDPGKQQDVVHQQQFVEKERNQRPTTSLLVMYVRLSSAKLVYQAKISQFSFSFETANMAWSMSPWSIKANH